MIILEAANVNWWRLLYRAPLQAIRVRVPAPLEVVRSSRWGFCEVGIFEFEKLRPSGLPQSCGLDTCACLLQAHCRAQSSDGSRHDGLFPLAGFVDRRICDVL